MNAEKEARQNFIWSVRTQRLCAAAVRRHGRPDITNEEASKTSRAEALEYIAKAKAYAEAENAKRLESEEITPEQAEAARLAIERIAEEATEKANELEA